MGIRNARVRATGKFIQVYVHKTSGDFVDASDCKTTYTKIELEFLN